MAKVLVLYYSSFGHIETMAHAVAEGARAAGATADVKRVPENVPEEISKAFHFKLDQRAPVATPAELANYDAIIVGAPTRFGRISSQMASFLDQAGVFISHMAELDGGNANVHDSVARVTIAGGLQPGIVRVPVDFLFERIQDAQPRIRRKSRSRNGHNQKFKRGRWLGQRLGCTKLLFRYRFVYQRELCSTNWRRNQSIRFNRASC